MRPHAAVTNHVDKHDVARHTDLRLPVRKRQLGLVNLDAFKLE